MIKRCYLVSFTIYTDAVGICENIYTHICVCRHLQEIIVGHVLCYIYSYRPDLQIITLIPFPHLVLSGQGTRHSNSNGSPFSAAREKRDIR